MSRQIKSHIFNGKRYIIKFLPDSRMGDALGTCDAPTDLEKEIRINKKLNGKELLKTSVHESLHALLWDLSEETVDQMGEDIGEFLWKLGYRKIDEKEKL